VVEQRPHLVKSAVAWWSGFEVKQARIDHAMCQECQQLPFVTI